MDGRDDEVPPFSVLPDVHRRLIELVGVGTSLAVIARTLDVPEEALPALIDIALAKLRRAALDSDHRGATGPHIAD